MSLYFTPCLTIRNGMFYFRKATPYALAGRYGKTEIKFSLKTRNPAHARIVCRELSNIVEQLPALMKRWKNVEKSTVEQLIRQFFEEHLAAYNENLYFMNEHTDEQRTIERDWDRLERNLDRLREQAGQREYHPSDHADAEEMIVASGRPLPKADELYDYLVHGVIRAKAESTRIYINKLRGNNHDIAPKDPLFAGCDLEKMPPIPRDEEHQNNTVGEYIQRYLTTRQASWSDSSLREASRVLRWFSDFGYKSRVLQSLTKGDMIAFRDTLLKLPPNFGKQQAYQGKPLQEIAKGNEGETLSPVTLKKYHTLLASFFLWCEEEGYY